jgi:hypothetical protein
MGWLGLLLVLGVALATFASGYLSFGFYFGGPAGYLVLWVLVQLVVSLGGLLLIVWASRKWEAISVRNAALRPAVVPYPAAAAPYTGVAAAAAAGQPVVMYSDRTNTLAVLALVFGLLGGTVLPIVFGSVALRQIRLSGERGHGMAVAGLVLGWISVGVCLIIIIVAIGITVSAGR